MVWLLLHVDADVVPKYPGYQDGARLLLLRKVAKIFWLAQIVEEVLLFEELCKWGVGTLIGYGVNKKLQE